MDKCFWKKVLAVVFGISIVSFLATAVSTINYKLTANDDAEIDLKAMNASKLIDKNVVVLIVLAICIIGIIIALQLIKNDKLKIGVSGTILVVSIVASIIGIVLLWNYRDDMRLVYNGFEYDYFVKTKYVVWQEYISNMMTLSFYAVISIASLFTNTLITEKKDA